ncbi:MAG: aminotransferase class I/II-fold pyridoxal phosphate-dependent enzyme, partial [Nitrospiraceae bacterium]|nr:aminotransferase class I/II-fold pyridoxal phosphate-dependent enzyme [Nitrospiraceae bacterium]
SGVFQAVQEAGITALESDDEPLARIRQTYRQRRDALYSGLKKLGIDAMKPEATFYLWASCPPGYENDSRSFAKLLIEKARVAATPGVGFGASGEGYIRFALTVPVSRIEEAVHRIGKSL